MTQMSAFVPEINTAGSIQSKTKRGYSLPYQEKTEASNKHQNSIMPNIIGLDQAILFTLKNLQEKHGKRYSFPTQKTLLALIFKYYNVSASLSTLNRHLKRLDGQEYFTRTRRTKYIANGLRTFTSTLYTLCYKAYNCIGSIIRKASCYKKQVFNRPPKKESPSIPSWMPGPGEGRLLRHEEVAALARGLSKDMA